jgi:hypothetical protein
MRPVLRRGELKLTQITLLPELAQGAVHKNPFPDIARENKATEVAIHWPGVSVPGSRKLLPASKALSEGRDAAPSLAPHPQKCAATIPNSASFLD